jgi:hypothetical protein
MLVREIWKCIHPRVSYSLRVNKCSYFLNPYAINVLLYRMKSRKHIHVKYCWQTYFKSIGTLSQTFKNHIHNKLLRSPASDAFRMPATFSCQRTITLTGKTRDASERMQYDFYFTEYDFFPVWSRVLIFTHCSIKLIYLW